MYLHVGKLSIYLSQKLMHKQALSLTFWGVGDIILELSLPLFLCCRLSEINWPGSDFNSAQIQGKLHKSNLFGNEKENE